MKRILLVFVFALFGILNVNAQEKGNFKLGAHLGVPVGDLSKSHSFNIGVDLAWVYPLAQNFKLGIATGYSHYTGGKEFDIILYPYHVRAKGVDGGMIPVAATAQLKFGNGNNGNGFVGLDLGYAFFTGNNSNVPGGIYYQPKVGYSFGGKNDIYISFKGISIDNGGDSANAINLGYAFNF